MRKLHILLLMAGSLLCGMSYAQEVPSAFVNPPKESRPLVWWHWIDGNISKDGIKADLEWMHRSGIAGFQQFDAGGAMMQMVQPVQERVMYLQDDWKDAFSYAIHLADSLDMEVGIASAPGWSSTGGPWVMPEDAMKKLTWRTMEITGGGKKAQKIVLPEPYKTIGRFQNQDAGTYAAVFDAMPKWYEDIAVIAVRLSESYHSMLDMGARVLSSGGDFTVEMLSNGDLADGAELPLNSDGTHSWIQYSFAEPTTIRALTLAGGEVRDDFASIPSYGNYLLCSQDGLSWSEVCRIPSCGVSQLTLDIPETTARQFRLMVINPVADMSYAAFGVPVVQPTGTRIHEFILHGMTRVNHAEEKAGFTAPNDLFLHPTPTAPATVEEVLDLTGLVHDGTLEWKAPAGKWRIYRFGTTLTGKMNHPAPDEATGLEVDKLDPDAWTRYFKTYLDLYRDAAGGLMGERGIQYILTDSYEAQQMTWTPKMEEQFRSRRGYDLRSWLPVLTGEIIGNDRESERFLFDWRATLGELFAENYDRINDIVAEYGMKGRYTESHEGGRLYVGDGMDLKRSAAIPMSAIWTGAATTAEADIRESASVAHLYGQKTVAAESFTANGIEGNAYGYYPGNLKATADLALASGLNRFIIHESPHQPSDDLKPGLGLMIFGQWFSRHETWAEYARYWTDYLSRSCYMLRQGRHVADILWYYGEDTNIVGLYGNGLPNVPEGYSYDFLSPHALLNLLKVYDSTLVTDSGMTYKVIVLDDENKPMSLAVLRKLDELVRGGAVLCGRPPMKPAGLLDDAAEFDRLVTDIWYAGRQNVHTSSLKQALAAAGVQPDMDVVCEAPLRFVHRVDGKKDIYWVRNFGTGQVSATIRFRNGNGPCQVLDPETGRTLPGVWDGRNLHLEDGQALFLVFDPDYTEVPYQVPVYRGEVVLDEPWTVEFDGVGAPEQPLVLDRLFSLTESDAPAVKYFSGTSIYSNTFTISKKEKTGGLVIDLGEVGQMAEVLIDGENAGFLWKAPYKLEYVAPLKPGKHSLTVKVVNLWANRLVGDAQPGAEKHTYTVIPFYGPDSPLIPSGLIGPVKLCKYE